MTVTTAHKPHPPVDAYVIRLSPEEAEMLALYRDTNTRSYSTTAERLLQDIVSMVAARVRGET